MIKATARIMMPTLAVTGVSLALTFGGWNGDSPIGEYDVPGGTLTVHADHSAYFQPDEDALLGHCAFDDTNPETGEWHEPIWACVPMFAPDGTRATMALPDDGSGAYGDSPWHFDPELHRFTR